MADAYRHPALIGETTTIRHAVPEFLDWIRDEKLEGVQPRVHDRMVWLTQTSLAALFGCTSTNIATHLKRVFTQGDLVEDIATLRMPARAADGKRYTPRFYSLDVAVSLSYRICTEPSARFLIKTYDVLMDRTYRDPSRPDAARRRNLLVDPGFVADEERFSSARMTHEAVRTSRDVFSRRIAALVESSQDWRPGSVAFPPSFSKVDGIADQSSLDKVVGYYVHYAATLDSLGILVSVRDWNAVLSPLASHAPQDLATCTTRVVHDIGRAVIEHEYANFCVVHGRTFSSEFEEFMTMLLVQERENDAPWLS